MFVSFPKRNVIVRRNILHFSHANRAFNDHYFSISMRFLHFFHTNIIQIHCAYNYLFWSLWCSSYVWFSVVFFSLVTVRAVVGIYIICSSWKIMCTNCVCNRSVRESRDSFFVSSPYVVINYKRPCVVYVYRRPLGVSAFCRPGLIY